ncbi:MAG TPA: hypothetical protein VMS02_07890 [Solirubrobacteraceae bacterium]|nr:hypothetical protein [Solirubrobacteraceae bacterium]
MAIALLFCIAVITLRLTHGLANGRLLAAIALPLELAGFCVLLSMLFERRAQTQEYMLAELVLRFNGDLTRAFPLRPQRARARVEARTPVLTQFAQDLLEIARKAPCAVSRITSAWVALVLASVPCGQWAWHAVLHESPGALLAGVAIAPGMVLFTLAFNDLRWGRIRSPRHQWQTRIWAHGYKPEREPTILPTVPVMVLCFVPAIILGGMWSNGASLETNLSVTQAVLTLWLLLWNGRKAASSKAFLRIERALAPLDRFIRENVARAWDLLLLASRACGWGAAGVLALSCSWPVHLDKEVPSVLSAVSGWLLTASLLLGLLMLNPWQRPVSPVTYSARHLLRRQGEAQEQRISTGLNVAFVCSLLAFVVTIGAT